MRGLVELFATKPSHLLSCVTYFTMTMTLTNLMPRKLTLMFKLLSKHLHENFQALPRCSRFAATSCSSASWGPETRSPLTWGRSSTSIRKWPERFAPSSSSRGPSSPWRPCVKRIAKKKKRWRLVRNLTRIWPTLVPLKSQLSGNFLRSL